MKTVIIENYKKKQIVRRIKKNDNNYGWKIEEDESKSSP